MNIRKVLLKIYWATSKFIAPKLRYSQYLYEDVLNSYVHHDKNWLDLGCGHQVLPEWRLKQERQLVDKCKMIVGIDFDLCSLRQNQAISNKLRGEISKLPFKGNSFDIITANMVVEHLKEPDVQFREINRVLKPGGIFIFHTPNIWGYFPVITNLIPGKLKNKIIFLFQGRKEEDIFTTYYRVNNPKRIICFAKKTGFEILKIKMLVSSASFAIIPPLMLLELIWIRILMKKPFKPVRPNIIAILKKQ